MTKPTVSDFTYDILRRESAGKPIRLLIEASAGTGKTYTLERIIVHYLIHGRLDLENILLVTFTNKATRELRIRIRTIIATMLENPTKAIAILQEIGLEAATDWQSRLRKQQQNFANAPIFTIHGFSQSVLKAYPVESGALINIRLDNNYSAELLRDYMRFTLLEGRLPLPDGRNLEGEELTLCLDQAMTLLSCKTAEDLIAEILNLQRNGLLDENRYQCQMPGCPDLPSAWSLVSGRYAPIVRMILTQNLPEPLATSPAADFIREVQSAYPTLIIESSEGLADFCCRALALNFVRFLLAGLSDYRDRQSRYLGVMSFDDQIAKLDQASQEGGLLLPRLQEQYKLILIDEFQDTDRVQWGIFRRIAGTSAHLIAVGDPKQAIYGFRGADLNTYLAARKDLGQTCRLSQNFRSTPALVQACNNLFNGIFNTVTDPDFAPRLRHESISPGLSKPNQRRLFDQNAQPLPVLNAIFLQPEVATNNDQLEKYLLEGIISAIQTWVSQVAIELDDGTRSLLQFQDICILTQDNVLARKAMKALTDSGIPARVSGQSKLFETDEAKDLQILLDAIEDPGNLPAVRRLILTRFFGIGATELRAWQNGDQIGNYLELCAHWHADFPRLGLEGIFAELEPALRARLLKNDPIAATRSLANFRHLTDLFRSYCWGNHVPAARIGLAFRELCAQSSIQEDDSFRLDSDIGMVRIMTMHSAKGLEFPVVFLFGGFRELSLKEKAQGSLPTLDLQSATGDWVQTLDPWASEIGRRGHFQQEWEAWLRLFYVAATRARSALFLPAWRSDGAIKEKSKILFFMYDRGLIKPEILHEWTGTQQLSLISAPATAIRQSALSLQSRLPEQIPPGWRSLLVPQIERQSSFTSLSSHGANSNILVSDQLFQALPEDNPDYLTHSETVLPEPGGTQYGVILHAAMEHMDFTRYHQGSDQEREAYLDSLFTDKLAKLARGMRFGQGFPGFPAIRDHLRKHLHLTMGTELIGPGNNHRQVHSLNGQLARREATFHARIPSLANIAIPPRWGLMDRQLDPGYLTGSIDFLVPVDGRWAIIDWKTNRAGEGSILDIEQVMQDNEYYLQSLIYQSAIHQWLCASQGIAWNPAREDFNIPEAQRIFNDLIGPVWYVFSRYGKAVSAGATWEELLDFQRKAVLYAQAI